MKKKALAIMIILAAALSAQADTLYWNTTIDDYGTDGNWTPVKTPTSADELRIDNGGTAQIFSGTAEADILILANAGGSIGHVVMAGSSILNVGNLLKIGARGLASMDVGADASVTAGTVYVGINEIGNGERILNLAGSMSVGGNMFVASSGATGIVNLAGGSLTVAGNFNMDNYPEEDYRSATLTVDGSSGSFAADSFSGADEDVTLEFIADAGGFTTLVVTNAIDIDGATLNISLGAYSRIPVNLVLMDGDSLTGIFGSVNITGSETATLVYDTTNGDLLLTSPQAVVKGHQRVIEWIDAMPNQPEIYSMRDWKQVARDLDALLFDWNASGTNLPLIELDDRQNNYPRDSFSFGAYVGRGGNVQGVTAVLNGDLAGIDKSSQDGHDYLIEMQEYYVNNSGLNLYGYSSTMLVDSKFKNTTHFNLGFYQLYDRHRDVVNYPAQFTVVADKWYDALDTGMGGGTQGWADFWNNGFDFDAWILMAIGPQGSETWADCAGAVAYLQYMAWRELQDPKYLDGADWCLRFMEDLQVSPFFEWHIGYGPYVAARRNMEQDDRRYDVHKLITWCFEPDPLGARGDWQMEQGTWPNAVVQPYGLLGGSADKGKRFMSSTANTVINMVPLVKYDDRYARIMGKWLMHVANSARLWYANSLPAEYQQAADKAWADVYDTNYALAYEQVQKYKLLMHFPSEEFPSLGAVTGDLQRLDVEEEKNDPYEILQETVQGDGSDALEHVWRILIDKATDRTLSMRAMIVDSGDADAGFDVYYAMGAPTNWQLAFTVSAATMTQYNQSSIPTGAATNIYIKVVDTDRTTGNASPDTLEIDWLRLQTTDETISPYLTGPWCSNKMAEKDWGEIRNFALYMSVEVGRLARSFGTTDVEQILSWDLNASDFFKGPCFPTHLYYNPWPGTKTIHVDVGTALVDLYDTVSENLLAINATGTTAIAIPADTAVVIVQTPAGGVVSHPLPYRTAVDGVVVDYLANQHQQYFESFENGWPEGTVANDATLDNATAYNGRTSIALAGIDSVVIPISAAGLSRLEVTYARYFDGAATTGDFYCEFYDGQGWRELEHYVGVERAPDTTWKMKYVDVPTDADDCADFKIRFRVNYSQGMARVDMLTLTASSLAPVANDQSATTPEDIAANFVLTATVADGTNLIYAVLAEPGHGTLDGLDSVSGSVVYVPETNYFGSDSFTFNVSDGSLISVGTVSLTVTSVNDAPEANSQSVTIWEDISRDLVLTAMDVDSSNLVFTLLAYPAHGGLTGLDPEIGGTTYTPGADYYGDDSFTFTVNDGSLSSTGTVDVTVMQQPSLAIDLSTPLDDTFVLAWPSVVGQSYQLFYKTNLFQPEWVPAWTGRVEGSDSIMGFTGLVNSAQAYFILNME